MSGKIHTFSSSLSLGSLGEQLFVMANPHLRQLDGRTTDFVDPATGEHYELKSDYWAMSDTPNFFIERYSDMDKQTPGGPFQALEKGAHKFVYMYVKDLTYYVFDNHTIVSLLHTIIPTIPRTLVRNTTHTTEGYRVPRALLSSIATKYRINLNALEVAA